MNTPKPELAEFLEAAKWFYSAAQHAEPRSMNPALIAAIVAAYRSRKG